MFLDTFQMYPVMDTDTFYMYPDTDTDTLEFNKNISGYRFGCSKNKGSGYIPDTDTYFAQLWYQVHFNRYLIKSAAFTLSVESLLRV